MLTLLNLSASASEAYHILFIQFVYNRVLNIKVKFRASNSVFNFSVSITH